MTSQQPGRQEPDPEQTIRRRSPHPEPPRPAEPPATRRLEYTPDMLPDVQLYETRPPRSGWRWVIVVGGLVLLLAALAVAAVLWVRSAQAATAAVSGAPSHGAVMPASAP
ncbi:hypothetical protein [Nonomuraea sp. NPDC050783]|uniref:hypothetical protein n=1 Tax=Nonomuraea sp. NPDC050783 TaxID=3154634 RepID=UPI0034653314